MQFPRNFLHVGLEVTFKGSYWSILTLHHEGHLWLVRGCEQAGSSTEVSLHKNILELSSGGNQFCFRGHVLSFYKEAHGEGSPSQNSDSYLEHPWVVLY